MKRIGIISKLSSPTAVETSEAVAVWLKERGAEPFVERAVEGKVKSAMVVEAEELADTVEALCVLGGDGTMLHAVRLLDGRKTPILGVNLGGLGFLTAITTEEMYPELERVLSGDFSTEERMMLDVSVLRGGESVCEGRFLNDAVIKGTAARLVMLETRINKEYVTTYRADGLIVATPTGSTAYSLSAAGPILYPTIHSITVSPICPFNLTNRPVVIPDWMTVEVTIKEGQEGIYLTLDGQVDFELEGGDVIDIKRADTSVFLVRYEAKSYFDVLRERLMWEVKPGT